MTSARKHPKGRAAGDNPANRFEAVHPVADFEQLEVDDELLEPGNPATQFLPDASQSIIAENDSPDVGFRYSINAYRGCEHGCAYCYARPSHEMLGMGAGLDFETKILVKHEAPRLLRAALCKPGWAGEVIVMSGVTDCYQPAERRFRLTRGLLEVMLEARQPVGIITKNALVLRDLDLLTQLAELRLVQVNVSVTTLDAELARSMEPRTSSPAARLQAIAKLSQAGVPTRVMVAPVVPGLTDHEMPQILTAARGAGARSAGYVMLRLPWSVLPVFDGWLASSYPDKQSRVQALIRGVRGGKMYDSTWHTRGRGQGPYAKQVANTFEVFTRKLGLDQPLAELDSSQFRPPRAASGQMSLF